MFFDSDLQNIFLQFLQKFYDNKILLLGFLITIGAVVLTLILARAGVIMTIKWTTGAFSNPAPNETKASTAEAYFDVVKRGDQEAMARYAHQDSQEQRGLE